MRFYLEMVNYFLHSAVNSALHCDISTVYHYQKFGEVAVLLGIQRESFFKKQAI